MNDGSNAEQVRELAGVIERKARESIDLVPTKAAAQGDPYAAAQAVALSAAYREYYLIQSVLFVAEQLAGIRDAILEQALYEEEEIPE